VERLPEEVEGLFCSEVCSQTAKTVRYWRRVVRDGRFEMPDVRRAVSTRVAHLLAGGYREVGRRLTVPVRQQVWRRDEGKCVQCRRPGAEIDHIHYDSPDLDNLQLLCADCHHAKTAERMAPANERQRAQIVSLYATRVRPDAPTLLCDDEQRWPKEWLALKKARRQMLLDQMEEMGLDVGDFRGAPRVEMIAAIEKVRELFSEGVDPGGWTEDDDSGYGPYSYFAHAMAKDD